MLAISEEFKKEANLINGEWVSADSGETFDVNNPATGAVIGTVPNAGKAEAQRAVQAAADAFKTFGKTTAKERSEMLHKLHDVIMENQESLAHLLSAEQGKPLAEARGEVGMSAAYIRWYAAEARRVYGDVIPSPWNDRRILVTREPIGVVSCITPWNFPSSMLARKVGPAIAAGCTVVCKPAEATPYSGLAWGVLAEMAGIPPGVVNVVTGNPIEIGEELTTNPHVRKVTFTGSTRVGKIILEQCSRTVKKCSMELGGNAPFIVFDDADIDRAVEGAIAAKYRNSGQTCVCTNRFYAQAGIYDAFVEKMIEATTALKVGEYTDEEVKQGPLINEAAVEKCEEFVADAVEKGGKVATGGARHALGGNFFEPTIITNASSDMKFSQDEIFGPVAPIYRFESEDEVIAMANDTNFGLAAYFYTRDLGRTYRVMEALEYGLVGVNEGVITTVEAPFGGFKESGLGKEGGYQGIEDYVESKYVCVGGLGM
ncbi:MAG: NAD-dependent succinate-semialdehyde dehydrogenase [Pseudomonadota bacterium]